MKIFMYVFCSFLSVSMATRIRIDLKLCYKLLVLPPHSMLLAKIRMIAISSFGGDVI